MPLTTLPPELLYLITDALPTPSLSALARTSKHLRAKLSVELTNRERRGDDHVSAIYHAILDSNAGRLRDLLSRTPHRVHGFKPSGNSDGALEELVTYVLRKRAGTDIVGRASLHFSITRRKLNLARRLLDAGADPYLRERCDVSALHLAAMEGDAEMLRMMLACGKVPVGIEDVYGRTAIYSAVTAGRVECLRILLDAGEDVDRRAYVHSGRTVLSFAVARGESECVGCLLDRGADVRRVDRGGRSALGIAVANGRVEIVSMLLKAGARVSDGASGPDAKATLAVAERLEDKSIYEMLREAEGLVCEGG